MGAGFQSSTGPAPTNSLGGIERALTLYPVDQLFLNPDCGFGTFSNRPVNSAEVAFHKLKAIVAAVRPWRAS